MSRAHYLKELESVRANLVEMGETAVALFDEAIRGLLEPGSIPLAEASELKTRTLEAHIDDQHRQIHDQCLSVITLQAPVARDARLVTGVLDAIVDWELIGDYSYEIVTLSASMKRRPPSRIMASVGDVAAKVRGALVSANDTWRGDDSISSQLIDRTPAIRGECAALYENLSQLTAVPGEAAAYVDLMMIIRHFERILRHAVCITEQAAAAAPRDYSQSV